MNWHIGIHGSQMMYHNDLFDYFFSTTIRVTFVVLGEIPQRLLDGLSRYLVAYTHIYALLKTSPIIRSKFNFTNTYSTTFCV